MDRLFIGKKIYRLRGVDSTNNYTHQLLHQSGMAEGEVVVSSEQSEGKGQRNNTWESEAGKNLLFSILLRPSFLRVDEQFYLNKMITLALCDFIRATIKEKQTVSIKWPNDIYVNDRKIAGVLIECNIRNNTIQHSITGIGININQLGFSANVPNPTSIKLIMGKDSDLDQLLNEVCGFIESRYLILRANTRSMDREFLENLYRLETWCHYLISGKRIKARIKGVHPQGMLMLEKEDGTLMKCNFEQVRFLI